MFAIVTGGTKGIGRATAEAFAQANFSLILCARNAQDLETTKNVLLRRYPHIQVLVKAVDLSKKDSVWAFVEFIQDHTEEVEILVNNAGVFLPGKVTEEADGTLERLIETNLYSAYYLTRGVLPLVKAAKGHIFNLCSVASLYAYPNGGSYSVSKFALLGFSKVLREELKDDAVRVTAIMPGATWSDSWKEEAEGLSKERLMEAADVAQVMVSAYKLGRSAVVEEIVMRPQLGDL